MDIINKFSAVHTTAKPGREIKYIVVHYTAGVTSRAGSEAEWQTFKARISETSATPSKKMYYVQVGAFASKENAEKYLAEVREDYPQAFIKVI